MSFLSELDTPQEESASVSTKRLRKEGGKPPRGQKKFKRATRRRRFAGMQARR